MSKSKGRKLAEWLRGLDANSKAGSDGIKDSSISASKLEDDSVTNPKIADGAVHTANLADLNVTFDKLHTALVVTESDAIGSNDNDTTIATSAAIVDYVANNTPATYGDSNVNTHLNTATATNGEFLSWNGTDYDWASVPAGYTDSNVGSYLSANGYDTATSIIADITDSAPAALDTLNELAAALGDDANFSATTATSLGNRLRIDVSNQSLTGAQKTNALTNLGITATVAELNYVDGVTSNIQTQLNAKGTSSFSGAYADLSGKPTIPTNNNQLTNGAGFTTTTSQQLSTSGLNNTDDLGSGSSAPLSAGWYAWGSSQPSNSPDNYSMMYQLNDGGQPQQWVMAYGGAANSVDLYARRRTSGTWDTTWTKFWNSTDFTSTNVSNWNTAYSDTNTATVEDTANKIVKRNSTGAAKFQDLYVDRGDGTSAIYFQHDGSRYIYYTGSAYVFQGAPITVATGVSSFGGNVTLGGSGTIAGATWANGQFHLGSATSGWAMDPNEFYNSGASTIGTITGDLNLKPVAGSITTSRPFASTSTISCTTITATTLAGTATANLKTNSTTDTNNVYIRNTAPTVYLRDTNHRGCMLHNNSNLFYILRGSQATDSTSWATTGAGWPLVVNLTNNDATFGGNISAYSDARLKENVEQIGISIDQFKSVEAKRFDWKSSGKHDIGFIAQDVEAAGLVEVVKEHENRDPETGELLDTYKTLDYGRMVPFLWDIVQKQQVQIEELMDKIK